jgi:hypothetical protein
MADREASITNAFETTLASELGTTAMTMSLTSGTGLTTTGVDGFYLVVEPDSASQREYVWCTAVVTDTVTIAERYLTGSAAGSGLTHPATSTVRMVVGAQAIEDLHDRIDAVDVDHDGLAGLLDDDHTQYLKEAAQGGLASEVPVHDHSATAEAGVIAQLSDANGDVRVVVQADGDIEFFENDGSTMCARWDQTLTEWWFNQNLVLDTTKYFAAEMYQTRAGPDASDSWRIVEDDSGDSITIAQWDNSATAVIDRLKIIGKGTAVSDAGDVIFYDRDGVETLRWDESAGKWVFASPVVYDSVDTFDAVDIENAGAAVEVATHTLTGLVAGDIVEIEADLLYYATSNTTTGVILPDLDDVSTQTFTNVLVDNCSSADRRVAYHLKDTWQIHSTSSWSRRAVLEGDIISGTDRDGGTAYAPTLRSFHDNGTDDLTGSTVVTLDLTVVSGGTQTLYGNIKISKISST